MPDIRLEEHLSWRGRLWLCLPPVFRLFVYDVLISFAETFDPKGLFGKSRKIFPGLYIKEGYMMQVSEAHAHWAVHHNTTIPVPTLLDALWVPYDTWPGDKFYMLLSEVPGVRLDHVIDKLTPEEVDAIADDLKDWITQLRNMPVPTHPAICSASGGPIMSLALCRDLQPLRTFESVPAFHNFLHDERPIGWSGIAWRLDPVFLHNPRLYSIKFTHGDLNPTNMLMQNGRLSGLLDWEYASYLPEYWDYAMSLWGERYEDLRFKAIMDRATVEDYTQEMEAFVITSRIWLGFSYDKLSFLQN